MSLINRRVLLILAFLSFSFFTLRIIILSPDFIGFIHDWDFPMTNSALKIYSSRSLFIWNNENAGFNYVYPVDNLLRYLLLIPSLIGISGLDVLKLLLFCAFSLSGLFMYSFLKDSLKLTTIPSLIASLFYTTTPVFFNKLAAGHIMYVIAYALSPLIMTCFIKYISKYELKYLIITSLLISFITIQIQFPIMLTILLLFYAVLVTRMPIVTLIKTFLIVAVIISFIHSFWLIPIANNFGSLSSTLTNAGTINDLKSWSASFPDSLRMIGYRSPHFETVLNDYPYRSITEIASFLLVIISFSSLLISKRRILLVFSATSIITLIFTTVSGPFSFLVFYLYSISPVFNVFREVYHLTFLIGFSYSVMLGFSIHTIYVHRSLKKSIRVISIITILGLVVMNDPFIYSGNLSGQLQQYQLNDQNITRIHQYLQSSEDYRVLIFPMIQPFKYDGLSFYGIDPVIAHPEKNSVGNYVDSDFLKHLALYSYIPSSNLTNVLKILSVKYVFVRNDITSMLPMFLNQGQFLIGGEYYDIGPIWANDNLFRTMENQQNVNLVYGNSNLSIYENSNFLPHIYAATVPIAVDGNTNDLFTLLLSSSIHNLDNKAIFLSGQLNQEHWQSIKGQNNTISFNNSTSTLPVYNGSVDKSIDAPSCTPQIIFSKINPTHYEIEVENSSNPFFIIFNENFNAQWKAYTEDGGHAFNNIIMSYPNVKEADSETQFTPNDISYLFTKPLDEKYHFEANGYANAWYIDPSQTDRNRNGSFKITIYYLPQSYFYIGLILSAMTVLSCIGYLVYDSKYMKKSKAERNRRMRTTN